VSYSAARVIATEPESNTGTNFKITAADQIRPIAATTTTIVATHSRILHPPVAYQPVARVGRDTGAESNTMGTKSHIVATDHIRPIATTTPIVHASICIPSDESCREGAQIFCRASVN
jgi:hypothetical protein